MHAIAASRAALNQQKGAQSKKGSAKKVNVPQSKRKDGDAETWNEDGLSKFGSTDASFLSDTTLAQDRKAAEREEQQLEQQDAEETLAETMVQTLTRSDLDSQVEDASTLQHLSDTAYCEQESLQQSNPELEETTEEAMQVTTILEETGEPKETQPPQDNTMRYTVSSESSAKVMQSPEGAEGHATLPRLGRAESQQSLAQTRLDRRKSLASMTSRRSAASVRSKVTQASQQEFDNGFKRPPRWAMEDVSVEGPDGRRGRLVAKSQAVTISKFDQWMIYWDDGSTSDSIMTWEGITELYSGKLIDHMNEEDWRKGELGTCAPMPDKPKPLELKQHFYAALALPKDRASALRATIGANRLSVARRREEFADAVRMLDLKLDTDLPPGGALKEVERVQMTMLRSQMARDDPLVIKSVEVVGRWEKNNSGLRCEAKLASATKKAVGGYKHNAPDVGYHLGNAISEALEFGANIENLIKAEEALEIWEDSREEYAREELKLCLYGGVQNEIEEAIKLCQIAEVDEEEYAEALTKVKRMQWEQEINLEIEKTIQDIESTTRLERVIARAHSLRFVEEDSVMLQIGVLQVKMRFLAPELAKAVKARQCENLDADVKEAQYLLDFSEELMKKCALWIERKDERAPPDIMMKVLQQEQRSLRLELPAAVDLVHVMRAENDLKRVLGAVERHAEQLPAVIEEGKKQVPYGLKRDLVNEASEHLNHYTRAVTGLKEALEAFEQNEPLAPTDAPAGVESSPTSLYDSSPVNVRESSPVSLHSDAPSPKQPTKPSVGEEQQLVTTPHDAEELKAAVVNARMAGAPQELIQRADDLLQTHAVDVWQYLQKELELRIALAEADDIEEMDVDSRFNRLQDAEYGARSLDPPLEEELMNKVGEINIALAAERSLVTQIHAAEVVIRGDDVPATPASSSCSRKSEARRKSFVAGMVAQEEDDGGNQVEQCIEGLQAACIAARTSALEEAKKLIPKAEALSKRLRDEVDPRRAAVGAIKEEMTKWQGKVSALRKKLWTARDVGVPFTLLAKAYRELDKRKVAFLLADLDMAVRSHEWALATALALRGNTLRHRAKGDDATRLYESVETLVGSDHGVLQIGGVFRGERRGGMFGTPTWRDNPHFVVHQVGQPMIRRSETGRMSSKGHRVVRVTVAIAESSPSLTLAIHIVENNPKAAEAGCGNLLVPGYKVLASSNPDDDMPACTFDLPSLATEDHPIFIVPSCANGEQGAFTLVVHGTEPIEVEEVLPSQRAQWCHTWSTEVRWSPQRPYSRYCGGKRAKESAPSVSWYRNPQFRVRVTGPVGPALPTMEKLSKLVESFPFATDSAEDVGQRLEPASESRSDAQPNLLNVASNLSTDTARVSSFLSPADAGLARTSLRSNLSFGSCTGQRPPQKPMLQAYLVPLDLRQQVPAAIHIVQNLTEKQDKTEENPMRHQVVASSGGETSQYQVCAEVGTACVLPRRRPDQQDAPSEEAAGRASTISLGPSKRMSRRRRTSVLRKSIIQTAEDDLSKNDTVFVVPSLKGQNLEGAFTLHLVSNAPVEIEQVNC